MNHPLFSISPLGDTGLIIDFENKISRGIHKQVIVAYKNLKQAYIIGIQDIIPSYSSISIFFNSDIIYNKYKSYDDYFNEESHKITKILSNKHNLRSNQTRSIKIPVCYSLNYGLDLEDISQANKIPIPSIINLHTKNKYLVYMIGFLPGFPYMGEVDDKIAVPRKNNPRTYIPAGSIGIAGKQTGIYPLNSPGGWQIIGRTPLKLFNKDNSQPTLLSPGDEVEFYSITEDEFANY